MGVVTHRALCSCEWDAGRQVFASCAPTARRSCDGSNIMVVTVRCPSGVGAYLTKHLSLAYSLFSFLELTYRLEVSQIGGVTCRLYMVGATPTVQCQCGTGSKSVSQGDRKILTGTDKSLKCERKLEGFLLNFCMLPPYCSL